MIAERISLKAGLWLLPLLTVIGAGSVRQWYASELHGEVDLRMYAAVQAYALAFLLVALPLPPRYTRGRICPGSWDFTHWRKFWRLRTGRSFA